MLARRGPSSQRWEFCFSPSFVMRRRLPLASGGYKSKACFSETGLDHTFELAPWRGLKDPGAIRMEGLTWNKGVLWRFSLEHFTEIPSPGLAGRGSSFRASKQWVDSILLVFIHCFGTGWAQLSDLPFLSTFPNISDLGAHLESPPGKAR